MEDASLADPNSAADFSITTVRFLGKPKIAPGDVDLHSGEGAFAHLVTRPLADVEHDVGRISQQIKRMVEKAVQAEPFGMTLETVEVGLAFSAKGELMFIAEAGVEASIHLSYTPVRPKRTVSGAPAEVAG